MIGLRFWSILGGLFLLAAFVFSLAPDVDLAVAKVAFGEGRDFVSSEAGFWGAVHNTGPEAILALFGAAILLGAAGKWLPLRPVPSSKASAYLALTALLGPGLLVNAGLKSYWGRARPSQIMEFGGDSSFTAALQMADQCASNCSFVSGDAALGFAVTAFAFIVPKPWQVPVFCLGVATGALLGTARILQGAHFLSDIVFAGLMIVTVNAALAYWLRMETEYGA